MTARRHILPPSTTALERTVDQAAPAWDALADAFPLPRNGTPPAVLPWLAAELQLSQFARYFASTAELIEAGRQWLLVRGTAAAVLMAVAWVGFPQALVDEDDAYLHINLGRVATPAEINDLAHVVRASVPAHVRFWRVYWGHDWRPIRLDKGPTLDHGLLDNDSGVWVSVDSGEPVKASFGTHSAAELPRPGGDALTLHTHTRASQLNYDDSILLDAWRLDSHVLVDAFGGIGELFRSTTTAPQPIAPDNGQPGTVRIGAAPWDVPAALTWRASHEAAQLPDGLPRARGWAGAWDGGSWRPIFIESKHSEST